MLHFLNQHALQIVDVHQFPRTTLMLSSQATSLIQYLQFMKGRRLWAYEDLSLKRTTLPSAEALAALVEHVRVGAVLGEARKLHVHR